MNRSTLSRRVTIGLIALLIAIPAVALSASQGSGRLYSREELDQMLAPVALYPDSLLAQVLVAATFPDQVVAADRWASQNENLKGERLNAALDRQQWDLSVKALVPFPDVLAMMSERVDWTEKVGDAFMGQQGDVMDSVQRLRVRAHSQGTLQTTSQQRVVTQGEVIQIEPASTQVVYVPTYDPAVVYGTWMYPSYPPAPAYYPSGAVVASGMVGFATGVAVGAAWNNGWGHWDWNHHDCNVNVNRNVNINRNNVNVNNIQTSNWKNSNVNRRNEATNQLPKASGKDAGERATGGNKGVTGSPGTTGAAGATGSAKNTQKGSAGAKGKAAADTGRQGVSGQGQGQRGALGPGGDAGPGAGGRPSADSTRKALQGRGQEGAQGALRRGDGNAPSGPAAARGNRKGPLRGKDDQLDGPGDGPGGGPGGLGEGGGLRGGGGGFRGRR